MPTAGRPKTVLIVATDPELAGLVKETLRAAGYRVAVLAEWRALLDALGHLRVDLVVADAAALRTGTSDPRESAFATPLVLMADQSDVSAAGCADGVAAVVPLPLRGDALVATVRRLLTAPG